MAATKDTVADEFENALGELKLERVAALGEAAKVQVAMQSLLQHEAQRIENKLGPQHPRLLQLRARLQSNLKLVFRLEVESQLMQIDFPEVADEGAIVHGRIVDEDDLGIERLTVCLVDRSGAPVRETSEPKTDGSGYFAIVLDPEMVDRLIKQYSDGIFLAVLTARQRIVHKQPKPLALARGARLLIEVRLSRNDSTELPSQPPTTVVVPRLVGLTEREAMAALERAKLKLGERKTETAPDQNGRVLYQSPDAGAKLAPGSSVSLVIGSAETETVQVPSLVNVTLKTAKKKIKAAGLKLGEVSGPSPTGQSIVEKQEPLAEAEVPLDTAVNLVIQSAKK
jgi:hypothetical protein